MSTIGTLHESPLHAALKARYAQPGAAVEVELHGYVVDVVGTDCWIEIQTGHVAQIKRKLACLVEQHPVRLVLPVTVEKWLVRVGPDGATLGRRKSPQRGAVEWIFRELVSIPHLLTHPNFSLAAPLIQEEEVRRHDPTHNWRRQGWSTVERRLLAVVAEHVFVTPADLAGLLPLTLAEPFTARELAAALGHPVGLAHQMIYCLRALDALTPTGKAGRALTYRRVNPAGSGIYDCTARSLWRARYDSQTPPTVHMAPGRTPAGGLRTRGASARRPARQPMAGANL